MIHRRLVDVFMPTRLHLHYTGRHRASMRLIRGLSGGQRPDRPGQPG